MAGNYAHLDLEDRCSIARLHEAGQSIRQIAAALDRSPSTVSRELNRNRGAKVGYKPAYAQEQARARRWTGSRLRARRRRSAASSSAAFECGWSPELVAGWLRQQKAPTTISHETIYRFIYAQIRRTKNYDWRHYLPRAKFKRGYRGRKGGSPVQHIKDRVSIEKRPLYINARRQPGHWETDYLLFSRYGQSVLVAQERASRFVLLAKPPSRKAEPTAATAAQLAGALAAATAPYPHPGQRHRVRRPSQAAGCAWGSTLTSAILTARGKRAASKTPMAGSAAACRATQTCANARHARSMPSLSATTTPHANALASKLPPRYSSATSRFRELSRANDEMGVRGNDWGAGMTR